MRDSTFKSNGTVTFWRPAPAAGRQLQEGLKLLGLERYAPTPYTAVGALKHALTVFCQEDPRDLFIEPRESKQDGFQITERIKRNSGDEFNDNAELFVVQPNPASGSALTFCWANRVIPDYTDQQRILELFEEASELCTGMAVGACLTSIILEEYGGHSLRDGGSVYFVPADREDEWRVVANLTEECASLPQTIRVYSLRPEWDDEAVRSVHDAVIVEIEEATQKLAEAVEEADITEKRLEHKEQEAKDLCERILYCENILNQGLDSLRAGVENVQHSIATAHLRVMGRRQIADAQEAV